MREVVCRVSRTTLMARILDTGSPPAMLEGHVATCLRCQAAVAHALHLRAALARLSLAPPVEMAPASGPPLGWAAAAASLAAAVLLVRSRQHNG